MNIHIPYDPVVFEEAGEIVFASSFSSQTGSVEMLK